MVNNLTAIIPYRPPENRFIVPKIKRCMTLPVLRASTSNTSLVRYENRLARRYFLNEPFLEVAIVKEVESCHDLPEGGEFVGYNPQGHLILQGEKGRRIDAYI
jgi:hypothetical protein